MLVGIDNINFYTTNFYLDLKNLAVANNIDPCKYYKGLQQEKMSIPAVDEDVVTMAANAAKPIIDNIDKDSITTLMFATETGVDQSKAAGVYVHNLLGLNANCRVVELKQACYSSTAALQMACALVSQQPEKKVLVIASDIAKYDLNSPGESTQGCGAVALLISANPKIINISPNVGNYTEDVMDFWRPNYRSTALVDGKYSTKIYLKAMTKAWENFCSSSLLTFSDFKYFCYHLPFSKMGEKAYKCLAKINNQELSDNQLNEQLSDSSTYNKVIGNTYTASLYISFVSLLDNCKKDLSNEKICFFSYGSGCVAEFFYGTLSENYQQFLNIEKHKIMLENRESISYEKYLEMANFNLPTDGSDLTLPKVTTGLYRLSGINNHKRVYTIC